MSDFIYGVDELVKRYPALEVCKEDILKAYKILEEAYASGHKVLIAGNGGSCSDSEHIVGELMKGFKDLRPISKELASEFMKIDEEKGKELASVLQQGLPTIALDSHQALNTAFINDVKNGGEFVYAQQLNGLGNKGDAFIAISTSGNAKNLIYATIVAKARGLKVIALTGKDGGKIKEYADVSIIAPSDETFCIQEYHLPIYHCLCLMLERKFFN